MESNESKKSVDILVHYITGNHDEYLRNYTPLILGNIEIKNDMVWNGYYITHGDLYDGIVQLKWLGHLGSWGYELAIWEGKLVERDGMKVVIGGNKLGECWMELRDEMVELVE